MTRRTYTRTTITDSLVGELTIQSRPTPNGVKAFYCYFPFREKDYYADLVEGQLGSLVSHNEIMIFPADKEGGVDCGKVLYEAYPAEVTEQVVTEHIHAFCADLLKRTVPSLF